MIGNRDPFVDMFCGDADSICTYTNEIMFRFALADSHIIDLARKIAFYERKARHLAEDQEDLIVRIGADRLKLNMS